MKILIANKRNVEEVGERLNRKRDFGIDIKNQVKKIIREVKAKGDKALYDYAARFDCAVMTNLKVTDSEIVSASRWVDPKLKTSLKRAARNISTFHKKQAVYPDSRVQIEKGVRLWREFRPVERVGLYVPGGTSSYPSTVLMLGIPAKIAGCSDIVLCTPPGKDGKVAPATLAAANLVGIRQIYKVGGAGAIAAMAYGTETIPRVSKIFGPGNSFVATAKTLLFGRVDIDMPAGPSEIMILADDTGDPDWIGADLLAQLEHGPDSQAVLVSCSVSLIRKVNEALETQLPLLSRRAIIQKSLRRSFAVATDSLDTAFRIINGYAPEHLEIVLRDERKALRLLNNAGTVFLGPYASESLGDYATGANHTLPTAGFAKTFSGLSVESFGKTIQVQKVSKQGISSLRSTVETLALAENLEAHKKAVSIRFNQND